MCDRADVYLIVALEVACALVVVGVAVGDDLHADLLGVAPAEVAEIAHHGTQQALVKGKVGAGARHQPVKAARRGAPAKIGVQAAAGLVRQLGKLRAELRRHDDASHVALLALHQLHGVLDVGVGVGGAAHGDSIGHRLGKAVVADGGCRRLGARVEAMEGHNVQTAPQLFGEAVRKRRQHIQLVRLGSVHKFGAHAGAVLHLHRQHGHAADRCTARRKGTVFCYKVDLVVQREGKLFLAAKGYRDGRAQGSQRGFAGGFLDQVGEQRFGKQGAFGNSRCHK